MYVHGHAFIFHSLGGHKFCYYSGQWAQQWVKKIGVQVRIQINLWEQSYLLMEAPIWEEMHLCMKKIHCHHIHGWKWRLAVCTRCGTWSSQTWRYQNHVDRPSNILLLCSTSSRGWSDGPAISILFWSIKGAVLCLIS